MVDSFVSDRFEIIVEVELVNLSDIGQNAVDNIVSFNQGSSFFGVRQFEEFCFIFIFYEEMGLEVYVEDDGLRLDFIIVIILLELFVFLADFELVQGISIMEFELELVSVKKKVMNF